jgi:hypothetical protein
MTGEMETRPLALIVVPSGEPLFHERGTRIEVEDEGAGEYVVVSQNEGGKVTIDPGEWPLLRAAINRMVKQCRT